MAAEQYKLSYTAEDINAKLGKIDTLAEKSDIPEKISDFENDSGFITEAYVRNYAQPVGDYALKSDIKNVDLSDYALKTEIPTDYLRQVPSEYVTEQELQNKGYLTEYIETDPTVPAWAKAKQKPTYTAAEVGALPADTVIPVIPTYISEFMNDAGYITEHQDLSDYTKKDYVDGALATKQPVGDYALKSDIPTDYLTAIPAEYVTEYELNSKGYLTAQSLDGLATETFVTEQISTKADSEHIHSYNDLEDKPEIATDDEIIEMLMEVDMLPVVADADGSLLSDGDNILLW